MKQRWVVLFAWVALVALPACGGGGGGGDGGGNGLPCTTPDSGGTMSTAEFNAAMNAFLLANQQRALNSLPALVWHDPTSDVAYEHSWDMYARSFFSHTNPCGEQPWDRMDRAGISWTAIAENIAQGYATATDVVAGWMASPGHRDNILNDDYTYGAVGLFASPAGNNWTMILLHP
jgi:uncharacterized protein YkwD